MYAKKHRLRFLFSIPILALLLFACGGEQGIPGPAGQAGAVGTDGVDGTAGADGEAGEDGQDGATGNTGQTGAVGETCSVNQNPDGSATISCTDGSTVTVKPDGNAGFQIADFHGTDYLKAQALLEHDKYYATSTIDSATADAAGVVTVNFTVLNQDGDPEIGISSVQGNIAKLVPGAGNAPSNWVPYLYTGAKTAGTPDPTKPDQNWDQAPWFTPANAVAYQASREGGGTLTNHGDGTYTYVFSKNIAAVTVDGQAVTYEPSLTHRVSIMMGGHDGPTASPHFDFVPDGSAVSFTRNIVSNDTCQGCHGWDFHGHGGDRATLENCVTCHNASEGNINVDAQSRESMDMKVLVHKIHAGGQLATIPGADGTVWDDPTTIIDESADNGVYAFWGYRESKHEWSKVQFPAVIENCTKCHDGDIAELPEVNNWKEKPSRAACGSCHDDVNFETSVNHNGGTITSQTDDSGCAGCHNETGGWGGSIAVKHDFTQKDARSIPEFTVAVTFDTPARGYYVAGESPKAYVKLSDYDTGVTIADHSTFAEDTSPEGCLAAGCPAADGDIAQAQFFVSGPRTDRNPVLTTAARVQAVTTATGPFDLSGATSLSLIVDQGQDLPAWDSSGADYVLSANITVNVADGYGITGVWPNGATNATLADIAAWLNADDEFAARASAAVEAGKLGIRSRNLGKVYSLQLKAGDVNAIVFGEYSGTSDTKVRKQGGYYLYNYLIQHADPTKDDPRVTWTTDAIVYQLDPVDDLQPGSYIATAHISDRGTVQRGVNYKAASIGKGMFTVKQSSPEKPPTSGCASCHEGDDGRGLVFHGWAAIGDDALDVCASCHDYQPMGLTGSWGGAKPMSKRIHAIHYGSSLKYPVASVDHDDIVAGRAWDITLPQDARNCQACHDDSETSGSWATEASRLPCSGCHDKDAAQTHMTLMTYDPTPSNPWSGDEEESCTACH